MNQKGFANILLIGVIAILVVAGGYSVFFKETCRLESPPDLYECGSNFSHFINSSRKPVSVNPTQILDVNPAPTPTPTPIPNHTPTSTPQNETVNWKTYSNADFSLKYPATWYLETSSHGFIHITNYDSSLIPGSGAPISPENIWIDISTYPPGKYNNFSANETVESWVNKMGLSDKQNILVDGIKAVRGRIIYTGEEESGYFKKGESSGDSVNVIYNSKGYEIGYSPYGSKLIATFDKILSTFKFTK